MGAQGQGCVTSAGLLVLRMGAGGLLAVHGWGKLQMLIERQFDKFPDPIGLGNATSLVMATGAEFGCSLLVVLGLATRLAAIPAAFTMGVAAFVVHADAPWMMGAGASKEPALLYLSAFLALVFTGAGRFSLDAILGTRCCAWWGKKAV